MQCQDGKNRFVNPSDCRGSNFDSGLGGLTCTQTNTVGITSNPYYISQTAPPNGQDTKYEGCPNTFEQAGCGETVVTMLISESRGQSVSPSSVTSSYYDKDLACHGTWGSLHINALNNNGIEAQSYVGMVNEATIANYIESGWEVMIGCKINEAESHWTLARDVTPAGNIVFSDPFYGDGTTTEQLNIDYSTCETVLVKVYTSKINLTP